MSAHNMFTIEIYGFMHSLRTSFARPAHDAIAIEVEVRIRQIEDESRCMEDG